MGDPAQNPAARLASTIPADRTLAQWKNHYYYVLRQAEIARPKALPATACATATPTTAMRPRPAPPHRCAAAIPRHKAVRLANSTVLCALRLPRNSATRADPSRLPISAVENHPLEALLTFATDFQKFVSIIQSLERRNVSLSVVPKSVQSDSEAEE